jgi:hypothetical protein
MKLEIQNRNHHSLHVTKSEKLLLTVRFALLLISRVPVLLGRRLEIQRQSKGRWMAKIRKYKLSWKAPDSKNIIGYKLYWSKGSAVSYDSESIDVGIETEITLSSNITSLGGPIMFGIAAVDRNGNESDITTTSKPYYFNVPDAPQNLSLDALDDFRIFSQSKSQSVASQGEKITESKQSKDVDDVAQAIESRLGSSKRAKMKFYDDVGFRKSPEIESKS